MLATEKTRVLNTHEFLLQPTDGTEALKKVYQPQCIHRLAVDA